MRLSSLTGPRARDLALSALGQGGSALLTLLYLRVAVRGFSPEAYGVASAWLGVHVLLRGMLLLPLLQLLLYRFHIREAEGTSAAFNRAIFRLMLIACALFVAIGGLGLRIFPPTANQWAMGGALVGLLGFAEGLKSFTLNHLNLRERHGTYAVAMIGDAALRLVFLSAARTQLPDQPAALMMVPILASTFITLALGRRALASSSASGADWQVFRDHLPFLLPVAGFALVSWVTGLSDRYFLLRWAGARSTGLYAAVYGLFGTPFPLLAATLTQVFRPRLTRLLADSGEGPAYDRVYRQFFVLGAGGAGLLALSLWALRLQVAGLMLKPEHLPLLQDLPWLLAGQVALVLGLLFELEFYIKNQIRRVTLKQCAGLIAALGAMALLIPRAGIRGAMMACALYYSADCLTAALLWMRAAHRQGTPA